MSTDNQSLIERALTLCGVSYSPKSNRFQILCPFHDDTDPSAAIYYDTSKFYCFTCNKTASVYEVYAKIKSCSIQQSHIDLGAEVQEVVDSSKFSDYSIHLTRRRLSRITNVEERVNAAMNFIDSMVTDE